jgi:phosphoglycolate phosphatase-like HAD superfamily hydrolase
MRKSHLFYDFDGVLADSLPAHILFLRDMAEKFNLAIDLPNPSDHERSRTIVSTPMSKFFRKAGFPIERIEELDKIYEQTFGTDPRYSFDLFPGVAEIIDYLSEQEFFQGIISSNHRNNIFPVLQKNEILGKFNSITDRADLKERNRSKSEELGFNWWTLDIWPKDLVYVGDTESDYQHAKSAGVNFVGAGYGWQILPNDARFPVARNVSHLKEILSTLY